jgi:hypothetical protein
MAKKSSADEVNWDAAIDKLAELTERGDLEWDTVVNFHGRGEEVAVPPVFEANVKGRKVRVYEYQYKHYTDADEWDWATELAIEFVDENGNLEYPWKGRLGSRLRLLDAIRYRTAQVGDFLEEFLHE